MHGQGPPIVFAHGLGANLLIWYQQVAHFRERHRVVLYDARGFGRSTCEREAQEPRLFGDDLIAVCDAAGVERAAVVGQTIGAIAGLRAAIDYPDRVAALVLCGSGGGVITERMIQSAGRAVLELMHRGPPRSTLFAPGFAEREPVRAFLQEQIFGFGPPLDPAIMAGLVEARVRETELTGFSTPTLAVIGQHDTLFEPAALKEALAQIPGARVVEFGDSGHLSFFEEPARFNRLVQEFVERHPPSA